MRTLQWVTRRKSTSSKGSPMADETVAPASDQIVELAQKSLQIMIGVEKDFVIVDFGTEVSHMWMPPDEAETFAIALIKFAKQARAKTLLIT
jgi:hypothetical protein